MKIIIVGAGKIGYSIAEILASEGHEISVIDNSSDRISLVSNNLDVICFEGNAANPQILIEAGAAQADLVVAVTEKDEINMICAIISRQLGAAHAVARVRDPEYLSQSNFFREALGLSLIVNPEFECAQEISRLLRFPGAARVDTFSGGKLEIVEYRVCSGDNLDGLPLWELSQRFGVKVLVSLVERDHEAIVPNGSFVLRNSDKLSISGASHQLKKFFFGIACSKKRVRKVIIVGGSRTAVYLSKLLHEHGSDVTIIEIDPARCETLCELLPNTKIICGDAGNCDVLLEEGLCSADAFVTLTGNDGVNMICSMYAKQQSKAEIITKVKRSHFMKLMDDFGLTGVIDPRLIATEQLVRYARAMSDGLNSNIQTLYQLAGGKAEALEFIAEENCACIGRPLSALKTKPNTIVCAIIRSGKCIIPDGSSVIESGDHAVVICGSGKLKKLDDILEVK